MEQFHSYQWSQNQMVDRPDIPCSWSNSNVVMNYLLNMWLHVHDQEELKNIVQKSHCVQIWGKFTRFVIFFQNYYRLITSYDGLHE